MQMHNPPHPGHAIKEAIEAIPMTVGEFARHIGVSRNTLSRILNARSGVTADMSLRISEAFGQGSCDLWFRMQGEHDFWVASNTARNRVAAVAVAA